MYFIMKRSSLINSSSSISHLSSTTSTSVSKIQQQQGQRLYQSNSSIFQRLSSSPSSFIVGHRYLSTLVHSVTANPTVDVKVETQSTSTTTIVNVKRKIWIDSIDNIRFDIKVSLFGSPKKSLIEHIEQIAPKGVKLETISDGQTKNGCYVNLEFDPNSTSMQEIMDNIKSNAVKYNLALHCLEARGKEYLDNDIFFRSFIVNFDGGKEMSMGDLHSLLSSYGPINQMKFTYSFYYKTRNGVLVTFDKALSTMRARKCLSGLVIPESETTLKLRSIISLTTSDIVELIIILMKIIFFVCLTNLIVDSGFSIQKYLRERKRLESPGENFQFPYLGEDGKTVIEAVYPSGQRLVATIEGGDLKNTQLQLKISNTQASTPAPQIKSLNYSNQPQINLVLCLH
ncbi:hypothetical protein DFA_10239 [Cavenderia fasciculata]|uniref:RRM domain-containing protein n=1 Tax=Cavenderia fasciculata TaxID=261658 RepID=F4Q9N5_CACFS|nr:uncharacterized protein DFA_10239 [Cavenderia fasciculata]EGG15404.1 hypothetical protein DFA_10239 [Cavenderia fasciculata]|eukprot:XP_004354146.1 hypothetical protein DFA_10239 [Cavenderia fasciculata]